MVLLALKDITKRVSEEEVKNPGKVIEIKLTRDNCRNPKGFAEIIKNYYMGPPFGNNKYEVNSMIENGTVYLHFMKNRI